MDTQITTFTDKKGRTIIIGYDMDNIVAEHDQEEIAVWTFNVDEAMPFLGLAVMDDDYQRAGIGEEMLKAAEGLHENFNIVDHFTKEGADFFNGCREKGISQYNHGTIRDDRY